MRINAPFFIENAEMIEFINADLTCRVYDFIVCQNDSDVYDAPFLIFKKSEVGGLSEFYEINEPPLLHLL